jgi:hypothetical protein
MIIWIASYPKSGNTLLRSLLSAYFFTNDGSFSFDHLRKIDQFPNISLFEKLGIDLNDKNEIEKNYVKVQELITKDKKKIQFWKTHNAFCKFQNKYEFTNLNNTLAAIYVVRDPRNVATSFANHYQISINQAVDLLSQNTVIKKSNDDLLPVFSGAWNFNYNSWKNLSVLNRYCLVKYEDLVNNKKDTFVKILKFVNQVTKMNNDLNFEKINNAISTTDFEKLKKMEKKIGFQESIKNKNKENINFFNLGSKNNWRYLLNKDLSKKIEVKFKNEMIELGYL